MKMYKTLISLVAVTAMFTACGGGGGGSSKDDIQKEAIGGLDLQTKTSYNVLSGQTTYVTVLTGSKFINTETGGSFYEYSVKDKGTAAYANFDRDNFGILRYKSSGETDTVTVSIKDTRTGKSSDATLTFNPITEDSVAVAQILKTGQSNSDYGLDRNFIKDASTRFDVKDQISGLTWNDLATNTEIGRNVTYIEAKKECEDSGKRLPTTEELYSTVEYISDNFKANMIDNIFAVKPMFSWADGGKMMNYTLGYIAGSGLADFRCVEGTTKSVEHTMMTDLVTGDTYDLSTKLQWSKSTQKKAFNDAQAYCAGLTNEWGHNSGWKLPTINQLRSLADNGVIAGSVIGKNNDLISNTKVVDDTGTYYLGVFPTLERTGFSISPFNDTQVASITCVRTYSQADIDQVK
jgi:hypothetical protein